MADGMMASNASLSLPLSSCFPSSLLLLFWHLYFPLPCSLSSTLHRDAPVEHADYPRRAASRPLQPHLRYHRPAPLRVRRTGGPRFPARPHSGTVDHVPHSSAAQRGPIGRRRWFAAVDVDVRTAIVRHRAAHANIARLNGDLRPTGVACRRVAERRMGGHGHRRSIAICSDRGLVGPVQPPLRAGPASVQLRGAGARVALPITLPRSYWEGRRAQPIKYTSHRAQDSVTSCAVGGGLGLGPKALGVVEESLGVDSRASGG